MKNIRFFLLMAVAALTVASCFKTPDEQGYLGENIYLQGGDTLYVAIGAAQSTNKAFLDNSTRPVTFKIENVRNQNGERVEDFFKAFPTRLWNTPYDYLTDTTLNQVLEKLTYIDMTPLMINEVNGQLRAMESTGQIDVKPGDVYNVDVSVTNSKGTRYIEDYAVIKFEVGTTATDFICNELINGVGVVGPDNYVFFPYYEQVNDTKSNWSDLQDQIYAGETVKGMYIKKVSDEPNVGVKLIFKFLDKNGNLFDPAGYATYSTLESFITHGVNRVNDPEKGMIIEFPYTPWPVDDTTPHLGYLRGRQFNTFANLDLAGIGKDFASLKASNSYASWPSTDTYPELAELFYDASDNAKWPDGWFEENGIGWYCRLRSRVTFYQPGTYEMAIQVPYTTVQ